MNSNLIIEKEKSFIDNLCIQYNYDNNIRHLLYIIIPSFIIKYGVDKERLILDTFTKVRIINNEKKEKMMQAFYTSIPYYISNELNTKSFIVINNYGSNDLITLIDSIIHEFNHAINSYKNNFMFDDNYVYLRTGLTYVLHDKKTLQPIKKEDSYVLEEILNTKQTEEIMDIIKQMDQDNYLIGSAIYSINNETGKQFKSEAYQLESFVCNEILENKTFTSTLSNLRIEGNVNDIEDWFDNICGKKGNYKLLITYLNKIMEIELSFEKTFSKKQKLKEIKRLINKIKEIIIEFDNSTF